MPDNGDEPIGTFFSEADEEEYEDYKEKEVKGWGSFFKEIFTINKQNKNETNTK